LSFHLQDKTRGYDLEFSNAFEVDLRLKINDLCGPLRKKINNCLERPRAGHYSVKSLEWCSALKLQCENIGKMRLSDLNAFWEFTRGKFAGFTLKRLKDHNVFNFPGTYSKKSEAVLLTVSQRFIYIDLGYFFLEC